MNHKKHLAAARMRAGLAKAEKPITARIYETGTDRHIIVFGNPSSHGATAHMYGRYVDMHEQANRAMWKACYVPAEMLGGSGSTGARHGV